MTLRHKTVMGESGWNPTFLTASAPHPTVKGVESESDRTAVESCLWHLLAGLPQAYIVTLTFAPIAWKMVLIRALRDYCRIRWDNACKVWQVHLPTGWLLPWQPAHAHSIFHTACQELLLLLQQGWFLMCDCLLRTSDLTGCPDSKASLVPLHTDVIFQHHGGTARQPSKQTWKCLKSDCTVPLWDPSPESSTPQGSQALLSLDSGTVCPFVPSETFWAEDEECPQVEVECSCSLFSVCHQYPHLSGVLVTWPTAPVSGSVPTGQ